MPPERIVDSRAVGENGRELSREVRGKRSKAEPLEANEKTEFSKYPLDFERICRCRICAEISLSSLEELDIYIGLH